MPKKSASFESFPMVPPLPFCENMAILDTIEKPCYFPSNTSSFMRFFALEQSMIARISIHTNYGIVRLVFLIFNPSEICPKNQPFLKIFLLSPLCHCAKNGHFRHYWKTCYLSSNSSFLMRFFALEQSMIARISIHTNYGIVRHVFLIFEPSEVCPKNRQFLKFSLWSPLCQFAKNGHFRHFLKTRYLSSNSSFLMRFFFCIGTIYDG